MSDPIAVRVAAHCTNIDRYRRLLRTQLTDHERRWLHARLEEEKTELKKLGYAHMIAAKTPPKARTRKAYPSIPAHVVAAVSKLHENSGGGPLCSG